MTEVEKMLEDSGLISKERTLQDYVHLSRFAMWDVYFEYMKANPDMFKDLDFSLMNDAITDYYIKPLLKEFEKKSGVKAKVCSMWRKILSFLGL